MPKDKKDKSHNIYKKSIKYIIVFISIIVIYQIIFSPLFLNSILKHFVFPNFKDANIQFTIHKSSLFTGWEFRDIKIIDTISHYPILSIKKIKIRYFLPGFFLGHIGIREFLLENPKIYLIQTNQRWNYESLVSKTREEEPQETQPLPDIIHTYIPLKFYLYIHINNLEFYYRKEEVRNQKKIVLEELQAKNISFLTGMITKKFRKIPITTQIISLVETFNLHLNPDQKWYLYYKKNQKISGNPILTIHIYRSLDKKIILGSRILLKGNQVKIQKDYQSLFLTTEFNWNIQYSPEQKTFFIREISIKNKNNYLIFLKGKIQYFNHDWQIEIYQDLDKIRNPFFSLDHYGNILSLLTNRKMHFRGNIAFRNFSIQGKLSDFFTNLEIQSRYFHFNHHQIRNFRLSLSGNLSLQSIFPFLYKNQTSTTYTYGVIKDLTIKKLSFFYFHSFLRLSASIQKKISAQLQIQRFSLNPFTQPSLLGNLSGHIHLNADPDFRFLTFYGNLFLNHTQYSIDHYFSKKQNIRLTAQGNIQRSINRTKLVLNISQLSASQIGTNQPLIWIQGNTTLTFKKRESQYKIQLDKFDIHYSLLEKHLPANLKAKLISVKQVLRKGIFLKGNIDITLSRTNIYQTNLMLSIPSLHSSTIQIQTDIQQNPEQITIHTLSLQGWYNSLLLKTKGTLEREKDKWIPDLKVFLQYQNPEYSEIYRNLFLKGIITLEIYAQKQWLKGNITIRHFSAKIFPPCQKENKTLCKYFEILNLSLQLPFLHQMNSKYKITYQEKDLLQLPKPNFTIQAIRSNYSIDNIYFSNGFYFLGNPEHRAIEGYIQYKNNIVWIPYLKLFSFLKNQKNGDIVLRNFYFNLSDLNTKNMEFAGKFYLINYDLNALFPKAESVFKGNVSGYIFFHGKDLNDLIRNLNVNASIYRISKDFAGFAVRIIAPTIVASVVNNTLSIKGIDLDLKNGVVYSLIKIRNPGFFSLSRLIKPSEEEIRQERIPLAEFIKRSKKEVQMKVE